MHTYHKGGDEKNGNTLFSGVATWLNDHSYQGSNTYVVPVISFPFLPSTCHQNRECHHSVHWMPSISFLWFTDIFIYLIKLMHESHHRWRVTLQHHAMVRVVLMCILLANAWTSSSTPCTIFSLILILCYRLPKSQFQPIPSFWKKGKPYWSKPAPLI